MRILHIISAAASGGAEVYVKDLARFLSKQSHTIHIAFLSTAADAGRDVMYEEEFLRDLEFSGINVCVIGNEARRKPWLGIARVRRYIKKNSIDVCHSHLAYGVAFSCMSGVPVIYTHHTIAPHWGKLAYFFFNKIIDEYVAISDACANALRSYTGREVNIIANGVSLEKFTGYVRVRTLSDKVNVAMVGRIAAPKDYMNMLRALTLLKESVRARLKVCIAGEGDGRCKDELKDYIKKNGLGPVVEFVGVKQNVPSFLSEADLFLMSSSSEGLPISLIEATASGLPCIVTDVGGCAEVIEACSNGVLVPPKNPQALADAIYRFVSDESCMRQLSINAVNNSYKYSIDTAAKMHVELYESIVK